MSGSKLTVAELMARAGKEEQPSGSSRRRRRRSLEEGGISVAELTGSIPAVKEKPAESKHSAIKIDDPATPEKPQPAETPAAKQPEAQTKTPTEAKTESKPAVQPEAKPAVKPVAKAAAPATPAAKPAAQSAEKSAAKADTSKVEATKPVTPKPATSQPTEAESKLTPAAEAKTVDKSQAEQQPAAPAAAKPAAKPATKTAPAAPVAKTAPAAKQEGKPTLQAVDKQQAKPAEKTDQKTDQNAPAAQSDEKPTPRPAPSNEETMVLSIVDEKDPIRLTTGAFPVVPAAAVKPLAPKTEPAASKDAETAADAEFAKGESIDQAAGFPADTTQLDAVTGDMEASSGDTAEEDTEQSTKTSVFSIIFMAIVGVVLGAVIFLAFEMLWERLNNWLVALLAIAVTLGMVGLVHALRTSRDGFSMILAGVVGLVMTFGPLLIVF